MKGFYKNSEETFKVLKKGWLNIGKYGYMD